MLNFEQRKTRFALCCQNKFRQFQGIFRQIMWCLYAFICVELQKVAKFVPASQKDSEILTLREKIGINQPIVPVLFVDRKKYNIAEIMS